MVHLLENNVNINKNIKPIFSSNNINNNNNNNKNNKEEYSIVPVRQRKKDKN